MKLVNGWAFPECDEFMVKELKDDLTYQASHLRIGLRFVTDFSVGLDGGAHTGTWSRLMSEVFDKVIAVEPSSDTLEALVCNMRQFNCHNVDIKHVALGEKPGRISMVLDGRGLMLKNTGARHTGPGVDVVVETIDSWQLPSLGFLKLDVEGSEFVALKGARKTLERCRPVVLYEDKSLWHFHFKQPRNAVSDFLTGLGYHEVARASMDAIWAPA